MEQKPPSHSQGYQKQIKKTASPSSPAYKKDHHDYSSPTAKKIPLFMEAITNGNLTAVQQFIEEGMNVNVHLGGVTLLMHAASNGNIEIVEALLQAGANINERNDDGWTALHMAAFEQSGTDIVDLLMQSGIAIEAKNKSGKTALQLAEETKHRDVVRVIKKHQLLLQHDAKEWEDFLKTPEGKPYKLSRLYQSLSLLFKLWWMPILLLAGIGLLPGLVLGKVILPVIIGVVTGTGVGLSILLAGRMLRAYLDAREPLPHLDIHMVREKRRAGEPILVEVRDTSKHAEDARDGEPGPSASVTRLFGRGSADGHLDRDGEPDSKTMQNVKRAAVVVGTLLILFLIVLLVMKRGDLAHWYYEKKLERGGVRFSEGAFLTAVSNNNGEVVNLFIRAGIPLHAKNEKGETALIIASEKGYANIITKLVTLDSSLIRHYDNNGTSALMTAARQGHERIVQLLCDSGADVQYMAPVHEGAASALQTAVDAPDFNEQHIRIVRYLLQHGADVKARNVEGWTPLLFAVDRGRLEAAAVLIDGGADVNEADLKGVFPLMSAACKGLSGLIELLTEKGANTSMALPDGQTPLMCAAQGSHADAVNLLLKKGAQVNAKKADGSTALTDATRTGNREITTVLLASGADPAQGDIPDAFRAMKGKTVVLAAKNKKISDVLGTIAKTASQEGYSLHYDLTTTGRKMNLKAKGPWNTLLKDLAAKNRFVLVVQEKTVFVLP